MSRPTKDENKTARLNLALVPDLKNSLSKLAAIDELSVNALVEKVLSAYAKERKVEISEFDAALKKIRSKRDKTSEDNSTVKDADDDNE